MDYFKIREEFPITREWIFLDNAGAIPLPRFVTDKMQSFICEYYKEGITDHWPILVNTLDECRMLFAELIGAKPNEIALVGSTSEGMNIVANMVDFQPGDNVVVTDLEFPSNLFPWLNLKRKGVEVRIAQIKNDGSALEAISKCVDQHTRVVAVTHVAFPNGYRFNLAQIAELAHSKNAFLAVDAVQSAGIVPFNVKTENVDFLACSGFKWLLSPSGTGAFYCREELIQRFNPAYVSWFSVKNHFNFIPGNDFSLLDDAVRFMASGNINLIGFQGFREGVKSILEFGVENCFQYVHGLIGYIMARANEMGLSFISPNRLSELGAIINIGVPEPDQVIHTMREEKIYAVQRVGGVRFSPYIYNTLDELKTVMDLVEDHVLKTRGA